MERDDAPSRQCRRRGEFAELEGQMEQGTSFTLPSGVKTWVCLPHRKENK
jgi:hypothetical protein